MPQQRQYAKSKQRKRRKKLIKRKIRYFTVITVLLIVITVLLFKIPAATMEYIREDNFGILSAYKTVTLDNAEVTAGDLILVNGTYPYNFEKADKKVPIASMKNRSYLAKNDEIQLNKVTIRQFNKLFSSFKRATGIDNVCIISAYRDYAYQDNLFNERVNSDGYYEAIRWVALPGYSEHHTGLTADIAVADDNGNTSTFTGEDQYSYVEENCWKYGFIRRYPENKTSITGIANEPWHFRYVGKVHAYIMHTTGMCMEEYIDYVKNFTYGQKYIDVDIFGDEYKIYYIPASDTGSTELKVPLFGRYSVSGNNIDGFIITEKD